jgi:hypothetical protein
MTSNILTQDRLKELLHYDPDTGVFTWIAHVKNVEIGSVAGSDNGEGYIKIGIDNRYYGAHRLAWLYMTGKWPVGQIDHKKGKDHGNMFSNLRQAENNINAENKRNPQKNNKIGVLGVHRHNSGFLAQIKVNRKKIYLGMFPTAELAHAAYLEAKRRLHEGCTL